MSKCPRSRGVPKVRRIGFQREAMVMMVMVVKKVVKVAMKVVMVMVMDMVCW